MKSLAVWGWKGMPQMWVRSPMLGGSVPKSISLGYCGHLSDQHCNWTGCNTRSGGITIKTFAVMRKPLLTDKRHKLMCSTEVLFRHLLSVSKTRDIDLQKVLEHDLAAVPPPPSPPQSSTTMAQCERRVSVCCSSYPTKGLETTRHHWLCKWWNGNATITEQILLQDNWWCVATSSEENPETDWTGRPRSWCC